MAWSESGPVQERMRFVVAHESGAYTMSELCAHAGISRRTGYKWLKRWDAEGAQGLQDRSRAPHRSPQRLDPELAELLLEARDARPHWGPRKILARLATAEPELAEKLPAASTVGDLFRRHGRVQPRRRRRARSTPNAGALRTQAPNEIWTADYKGEFRLQNGQYCYPFTLADAHSRCLLACRAESSTSLAGARQALSAAFRTYGLPRAMRTDNGTPFVGHGISGLSSLTVWWIQLDIQHQRIAKGRPEQNGRHERMHRTLAAEATRPPERSFASQQRRFDIFLREFNQERPHEALQNRTPASLYEASPRAFPERIAPPEYPGHYEPRRVDRCGFFKFQGKRYFLAHPMQREWLGLVEIDNDLWSVRYYNHELGRITPSPGGFIINVLPMSPV
jgi:putative transposase